MPPEAAAAPTPTASPTPAPTPTATAPVASPEPASPAPAPDLSFDNLGSADDLDFVEVPEETVVQPEATPPAAEVQPAAAPPAPVAEPAPTPPTPAPAQQPAQAQPAAPAPVQADNSPQGLVQQLEQHRAAVISALAAERFKLSPEEVSALDADATAAIPQIMSRVYYEAMQSTLMHLQNQVPRMVLGILNAQKTSDSATDKFYGQFPSLDRGKHHQDVLQFATMLRQTNPRISEQDLFAMVGAAVMAKNGISAVPAAPAARPPQPAPFVPATPGASVRVVPEPESPYAGLGQDWDQ